MTILNVIELTKINPVVKWITDGCVIGTVLFFLVSFSCADRGKVCDKIAGLSFCMGIVFFIASVICGTICDNFTVPNGKYQYEIMIDDEVSFNDVIEQYNIIEQRGEIFVVEEKNND